ncbi:MAG: glycosyltransferase family 4 protein [Pseudomonadota bacterium]
MKIAFYAPMKSPNHPVPSGDRLMGRLLLQVLSNITSPSDVRLASEFRAYYGQPDPDKLLENQSKAATEAAAVIANWEKQNWEPDIWLTYHPYYKAPDWLGPKVAQRFNCPIITAEASYSPKRGQDDWAPWHRQNEASLREAQCHLYMKQRDRPGLLKVPCTEDQLVHLPPFIDVAPFTSLKPLAPASEAKRRHPTRFVTVAMMRADVKLKSYQFLAEALSDLQQENWTLDIVGDGAARSEVEAAFAKITSQRIRWHGKVAPENVPPLLSNADVFVWPGFDEAYGLAYLEAQASGLPVVAQNTAGVPEVVRDGETGILTQEDDIEAFRDALRGLIGNHAEVRRLGRHARSFVHEKRSLDQAQSVITNALEYVLAEHSKRQN